MASTLPPLSLEITMVSAMDLKADDVYVVSLSGDKSNQEQHIPIHKDGSINRTFVVTMDQAAAPASCLNFEIENAKRTKHVGKVDAPVKELLEVGGIGDEKPKVLSREVRWSSGETQGLLKFSYKFKLTVAAPSPAMNVDGTVVSYPPAPAPPAAYPPAMPRAARNPQTACLPNFAPTFGYGPPAHVHPPAVQGYPGPRPPATYQTPPPWAAQHIQPAGQVNALVAYGYGPLAHAHPPAGHGYPALPPPAAYPPPPPRAVQYTQRADPANAVLAYGYPPPAYAHPPAGHGYAAPRPRAGRNFVQRVMSGAAVEALSNMLGSADDPGSDDGFFLPMSGLE
ncbi:protein SRC2 homolog [Eucalyptus grandis]|uniref:protein SRC2 homolog n=1 Tax=Eucalyptus grandis TaxID=71139 RepID=UPI00192E7C18|nr:protein SRC2 homolog [Eucalyptus grandis]